MFQIVIIRLAKNGLTSPYTRAPPTVTPPHKVIPSHFFSDRGEILSSPINDVDIHDLGAFI
jgi:hypothetical protein